ncbi:hypothetical protein ES703_101323 [subsurface metagenome]
MADHHFSYHSLNIHPDKINVYYQSTAPRRYLPLDDDRSMAIDYTTTKQPAQFKDNYHQGRISSIAKRKMSRSLSYLVYIAKPKPIHKPWHGRNFMFKVNFITLTLSSKQVHSDQVIKAQLLNQFIIEMKNRWNVKMYIWRAEKQKNGRIHFHIVTGSFIPWNELRNVWNRIQQKLGYVTRYRANMLKWHEHGFRYNPKLAKNWPRVKQLKAYKSGIQTGWDNPNSVDIHSLRHVGNIIAYITKEMTKNEKFTDEQKRMFDALPPEVQCDMRDERFISGRLWSCSSNLTDLQGGNMDIVGSVEEELERVFKNDNRSVYDSDYFHVYTVDIATLQRLDCQLLIACFEDFIRQKFPERYLSVIT